MIGSKEMVEFLQEKLWNKEVDAQLNLYMLIEERKRHGLKVDPDIEKWLRYDPHELLERRKRELGLSGNPMYQ